MKTEFICKNIAELPVIAKSILSKYKSTKFALKGNLGSGKTTLIKAFCKELGIKKIVDSPTFTIINEYHETKTIYHFDFYRIQKIEELYDIGYEEYFFSDNYVFIEWPEKVEPLIPHFFVNISIEVTGNNSRIFICED